MPNVRIPSPLRKVTGGRAEVVVDGADVRAVILHLDAEHPGFAERVLDEAGELRRFVHVFVQDEDVQFGEGLDTPVARDDVLTIVPAVAGGAERSRGSGVVSTRGAVGRRGRGAIPR